MKLTLGGFVLCSGLAVTPRRRRAASVVSGRAGRGGAGRGRRSLRRRLAGRSETGSRSAIRTRQPADQTRIKVVYDDDAIYFGAVMEDTGGYASPGAARHV
jgi:hypothetical protein